MSFVKVFDLLGKGDSCLTLYFLKQKRMERKTFPSVRGSPRMRKTDPTIHEKRKMDKNGGEVLSNAKDIKIKHVQISF